MVNKKSSQIQVPMNLDDTKALRRFLQLMVEKLDEAFGARGERQFVDVKTYAKKAEPLEKTVAEIRENTIVFKALEDAVEVSAFLTYPDELISEQNLMLDYHTLPYLGYIDQNYIGRSEEGQTYSFNPRQEAIDRLQYLSMVAPATYDQAMTQEIISRQESLISKFNLLLESLERAKILELSSQHANLSFSSFVQSAGTV